MNPLLTLDRSDLSPSGVISRFGVSVAIAVSVSVGFLWTAEESPLPATRGQRLFCSSRSSTTCEPAHPELAHRGGLAARSRSPALPRGAVGLGYALAGAGVALGVLFVPFVLRWLGAGDVKAMMVLGALWGRE